MYIIKPNLCSLWKIGKNVHSNREKYNNVVEKYSDYFSYYFGNSYLFTRDNIHLMERFYLNFHSNLDETNEFIDNNYYVRI